MTRSIFEKDFNSTVISAAKLASEAAKEIQKRMSRRRLTDEDDITPAFLQELEAKFRNKKINGFVWDSKVMRHRRGVAAEEKSSGADFIITIDWQTKNYIQNKGLLVQAKRSEAGRELQSGELIHIKGQCEKMLAITPSAFVINYTKKGIRATSATKVLGTSDLDLNGQCEMTAFNFFKEFFKCSYGDPSIGNIDDFQKRLDHQVAIDELNLKVRNSDRT
jgi:hypothetical protein